MLQLPTITISYINGHDDGIAEWYVVKLVDVII